MIIGSFAWGDAHTLSDIDIFPLAWGDPDPYLVDLESSLGGRIKGRYVDLRYDWVDVRDGEAVEELLAGARNMVGQKFFVVSPFEQVLNLFPEECIFRG